MTERLDYGRMCDAFTERSMSLLRKNPTGPHCRNERWLKLVKNYSEQHCRMNKLAQHRGGKNPNEIKNIKQNKKKRNREASRRENRFPTNKQMHILRGSLQSKQTKKRTKRRYRCKKSHMQYRQACCSENQNKGGIQTERRRKKKKWSSNRRVQKENSKLSKHSFEHWQPDPTVQREVGGLGHTPCE